MTYTISQTNPADMATEDLTNELSGFVELAAEVAARMSALLLELRQRRVKHPFFHHPVLRFFESIAEGKLHPEAAVALGNAELIKAVIPLPKAEQLEVAYGKELPVATMTDTGDIVRDDKPITRMDQPTIKRVFSPVGVRTFKEQREIIKAEAKVQRIGAITVLRDEVALKIGNQKIKPEELRGPLLALGYTLDLTRRTVRKLEDA